MLTAVNRPSGPVDDFAVAGVEPLDVVVGIFDGGADLARQQQRPAEGLGERISQRPQNQLFLFIRLRLRCCCCCCAVAYTRDDGGDMLCK